MSRTVEAAFEAHAQTDILIVMRHYEGAELAALFNADALKVQAQSLAHVRRYAVVGAPAWANGMIALFDKLSPVDAKTFDPGQEDAARAWILRGPDQPA